MEGPIYKLEVFDGPLDLLLSLAEKHKIDIHDIQISLLLEQYMAYIEQCRAQNWELTADFIEMTARLMYIKSYSLLPPKEDPDEEDPKAELERMLQEYSKYKQLSEQLRDSYVGGQIFFRDPPPEELPRTSGITMYDPGKLEAAFRRLLIKFAADKPEEGSLKKIMSTGYVSVSSRIRYVENIFRRKSNVYFEEIFSECESKSEIIATFLAVLELLRLGKLDIRDKEDRIMISAAEEQEQD